jgi:proline dehydrogenase
VIARGGSVRLCKGAYREPASIAYPRKADVAAAYATLLERLLRAASQLGVPGPGRLPPAAIATHDPRLIHRAIELIHQLDLDARLYEFQMLYGVRRDLQSWLLAQGYPLRVYRPWGPAWYPYLVRRLAERPANLTLMVKTLLHEATAKPRSPIPAPEREPTLRR